MTVTRRQLRQLPAMPRQFIAACGAFLAALTLVIVSWQRVRLAAQARYVDTPAYQSTPTASLRALREGSDALGDAQGKAQREVVCWGDSMTEGAGADVAVIHTEDTEYDASYKSYPQVLQDLCGLPVFNCGVMGATSEEIVAMSEGDPLDDEGRPYAVFDQRIARLGAKHPGDVLVLEMGSNGGWDNDYEVLISQYWRIIRHAGCESFIIVGDTDDPGTSLGDERQEAFGEGDRLRETDWEVALREEFGDHFVNMRLYLIENGLGLCGLEEDADDEEWASYGCISEKLKADWTHLNSYGYYAKARGIYERGVALGYWT